MNVKNIASNQFLFTTIKVQGKTSDGDVVSGTGFFYAFNSSGGGKTFNALVTCRHVLADMVEANLLLHIGTFKQDAKDIAMQSAEWRKIANLQQSVIYHPDKDVDLCGIPIDHLKVETRPGDVLSPIIITIPDNMTLPNEKLIELTPMEEVFIFGFPAGLTDGRTGLPVIRKGVTAYHPGMDFNGKSLGLLDITSYPGSSGSPVLIYNQGSYPTQNGITIGNRGIFLGILIGYSPGATDIEHADLHLGAYIKAKALNDLKEEMLKSLSF
jgi:hypothetical protein